eukprot:142082-Heterocapsa_arctica.AAC.1
MHAREYSQQERRDRADQREVEVPHGGTSASTQERFVGSAGRHPHPDPGHRKTFTSPAHRRRQHG